MCHHNLFWVCHAMPVTGKASTMRQCYPLFPHNANYHDSIEVLPDNPEKFHLGVSYI